MESFKLILPEHLNHYGFLYGGNMLKWADEYGYIAARMDYPDAAFVTVGMDKVEFKKGVRKGDILRFDVTRAEVGNTSLKYDVKVHRANDIGEAPELLFYTRVTYVCIDENGNKISVK